MVISLWEAGEAISETRVLSHIAGTGFFFFFKQIIAYVTIEVSVIGSKRNDETS